MTATLISTMPQYTFGQLTNQTTSRLIATNTNMARLAEAIATASSGYEGTPGTEFEAPTGGTNFVGTNLFGIIPDEANPGAQGQAYSYAMGQLKAAWDTFWTAAAPYVEQLDNGMQSM